MFKSIYSIRNGEEDTSELPVIEINNEDFPYLASSLNLQSIESSHARNIQESVIKIMTTEKKKKSVSFILSKREKLIKKLLIGSVLSEETMKNIVNDSYKRVFPDIFTANGW